MNSVLENLSTWKLFVRVAGYRSFRSAARALDTDPSGVSRRIAQLEEALGVQLFDTSGQTLILTENGRRILRTISPLLNIADKTIADIRKGTVRPKRQLHILASAGFQNAFLWRATARFRLIHPETSFWVETFRQGDSFFDQLGYGVDIIVTSFRQENPNLYLRRVSRHPKICVASPGFVQRHGPFNSPQDLLKVPLAANVHFLRSLSFRKGEEVIDEQPHFAMLTDNSAFLADWAAAGYGVCVGCPSTIAAEGIREKRLVQICSDWSLPMLEGWAYASFAEAQNPDSLILTFLDFLDSLNKQVLEDAKGVLTSQPRVMQFEQHPHFCSAERQYAV